MKGLIIDHRSIMKEIRDYVMIALGCAMYTVGMVLFMMPYKLATGGLSGIALIIYYITGLEVQNTYAAINILLLLVAVKILGWRFCLKTIYGVTVCTVLMWLWQRLLEDPVTHELPKLIGDEMFMACILAAIIEGMGLCFCFNNNGSTGGTDIVAAVVNKYWDVSLGQMIMLCDVFIISSCYFVFHDWTRVIFGFVFLVVASMTLDYSMRRSNQSVEFKIFSRNSTGIADAVTKAGYGVTVLDGTGWWTRTERQVLVCIVRKRHTQTLMRIIKMVDPYCFFSVTNVQSVYGEGFDTIKTRIKNAKPILVYANEDMERYGELKKVLAKHFDFRTLNEVGCKSDDLRYIKQYFGHDAFLESEGKVTVIHGDPYGQFTTRVFNGENAINMMIDYLKS